MERLAKTYIYGVIGAGCLVLAGSLANWPHTAPTQTAFWIWAACTTLAVLASRVKLRLPGMEGSYSLSFLFVLYGVAHFSLAETLIAGCAAAASQALLGVKQRPGPLQVLFNAAGAAISIGVCFLAARVWLAGGMAHYLPAVMAAAACVYFVVNTVLVSGILALLRKQPLGEVCSQWYLWSFPVYLIGVTLVGLAPAPGHAVSAEAWFSLLPMVYLLHFFAGLVDWHASEQNVSGTGERPNARLPRAARMYLLAVTMAGAVLLMFGVFGWQTESPVRFAIYLALAVAASTLKIPLPYMEGTVTPTFVLLLAAIAQLSLAETVVMATVVGVVQVLWRSARKPMLAQVVFNPACLALSAALSWSVTRFVLEPRLGGSVVGVLVGSTLVLYGANTIMVAVMVALASEKPLFGVWQRCYFWSLPYYLVGAVAAGVMIATSRTANWPPSLLVLPLMGLVFVSYRKQLAQAIAGNGIAA